MLQKIKRKIMKLEYLKGYLGTGLRILSNANIYELTGLKDETYFIKGGGVYAYGAIQDCKPILHPLSDLTKFCEDLGFVPIEKLSKGLQSLKCASDLIRHKIIMLEDSEKIYEWHFDIHGLIEQGLAIDINTLEKGL